MLTGFLRDRIFARTTSIAICGPQHVTASKKVHGNVTTVHIVDAKTDSARQIVESNLAETAGVNSTVGNTHVSRQVNLLRRQTKPVSTGILFLRER